MALISGSNLGLKSAAGGQIAKLLSESRAKSTRGGLLGFFILFLDQTESDL
jgi:hypothetical protein